MNDLRIIALNTNLYYTSNKATVNSSDPGDQLAWLNNTLNNATADNETVLIFNLISVVYILWLICVAGAKGCLLFVVTSNFHTPDKNKKRQKNEICRIHVIAFRLATPPHAAHRSNCRVFVLSHVHSYYAH